MDYEIVYSKRTYLGEGIWWDDKKQAYFWVDIMNKEVHCLKDGVDQCLKTFDDFVGFCTPCTDDTLMVGCGKKILNFDPVSGNVREVFEVDQEFDDNRYNDGKCTPDGRIIAGTMNNALNEDDFAPNSDTGGLFVMTKGETPVRLQGRLKCPNGLAFASDKHTVFHTDTFSQTICAYEYDYATGGLKYIKDVIRIPEELGSPDGMTIAEDDTIYAALWGGGAAAHIDTRTGKILDLIKLPVKHVTCMGFGGQDLDELCITTSSIEAPEEEFPYAGCIFKVKPGVKGVKVDRFAV